MGREAQLLGGRSASILSSLLFSSHLPALLKDLFWAVADHAARFRFREGLLPFAGGFGCRLCFCGGRHFSKKSFFDAGSSAAENRVNTAFLSDALFHAVLSLATIVKKGLLLFSPS